MGIFEFVFSRGFGFALVFVGFYFLELFCWVVGAGALWTFEGDIVKRAVVFFYGEVLVEIVFGGVVFGGFIRGSKKLFAFRFFLRGVYRYRSISIGLGFYFSGEFCCNYIN